ncbi:MAG: TRAP transporter small permease [Paracoccaceae bacterium]
MLSVTACLFLFAMMALTLLDVLGRYLFASPLPAAYEFVSLAMAAIIFCALPLTNLREGHVTVDLLDHFVPGGLRRAQLVVVNLLSAAAMVFLSWRLAIRSADQMRFREVTEELWMPLWPFSAAMSALTAIAALTCLVVVGLYLSGARRVAEPT